MRKLRKLRKWGDDGNSRNSRNFRNPKAGGGSHGPVERSHTFECRLADLGRWMAVAMSRP